MILNIYFLHTAIIFIHLNDHRIHTLSYYNISCTFHYVFWNFSTIWNITEDNTREIHSIMYYPLHANDLFLFFMRRIIIRFEQDPYRILTSSYLINIQLKIRKHFH